MAISSRHFIRIGIILIGVPLAAQSPRLLPISLSVTQSWEHPAEMNSTRAVLSSKPGVFLDEDWRGDIRIGITGPGQKSGTEPGFPAFSSGHRRIRLAP